MSAKIKPFKRVVEDNSPTVDNSQKSKPLEAPRYACAFGGAYAAAANLHKLCQV